MTNTDLRNFLTDKNLTIDELADKLAISSRMIKYYLAGSHKIPRKIELALKIVCN